MDSFLEPDKEISKKKSSFMKEPVELFEQPSEDENEKFEEVKKKESEIWDIN